MAKEKKQFTELSDEDLKQVTGGIVFIDNGHAEANDCLKSNRPPCQQGYVERNHCCFPA